MALAKKGTDYEACCAGAAAVESKSRVCLMRVRRQAETGVQSGAEKDER
jgi:hypothetical protein